MSRGSGWPELWFSSSTFTPVIFHYKLNPNEWERTVQTRISQALNCMEFSNPWGLMLQFITCSKQVVNESGGVCAGWLGG